MKDRHLRLLSRIFQLSFVLLIIVGIIVGELKWTIAASISLLITFIPNIIRRSFLITLPPELNFLIVLALFLHTIGGSIGLYEATFWWDHVTHTFSAFLIAALGFIVVVIIDKYVDSIELPPKFLSFFIFMLAIAFGVIWEIIEFINDQLTGSTMQLSLEDTMLDLMFDMFGAIVVAVFGPFYLLGTSRERFLQEMNLDRFVSKIRSRH